MGGRHSFLLLRRQREHNHLADKITGALLEWYRYDLDGTPIIYAPDNTQRSGSAYDIRHLFTGQQWYGELGLYDLRNRFYSPDIGRFLQADPSGFGGDGTNLYRYGFNNPTNYADATGDAAYKVSTSGSKIFIQIPITYYGSGATPAVIATFNTGISSVWSGSFGPFSVTTSVITPGGFFGNWVSVYTGAGYMKTEVGGPYGFWHAQGTGWPGHTPGGDAAHEAGHFLGLYDRYDMHHTDANGVPISNAPGNIMGSDANAVPSADDIAAIVKGTQGPTTTWGHLSNGAPFVSFVQEPGFNGPAFTGMGEYIGGYGGYFDSSGQFNGVLGDPGGYNVSFYGTMARDHAAALGRWAYGLVSWNSNMWGGNCSSGAPWLTYAQR